VRFESPNGAFVAANAVQLELRVPRITGSVRPSAHSTNNGERNESVFAVALSTEF
jgi:hypothetical protein